MVDYTCGKGMLSERGNKIFTGYFHYYKRILKKSLTNCQVDAVSKIFNAIHIFKRAKLAERSLYELKKVKECKILGCFPELTFV